MRQSRTTQIIKLITQKVKHIAQNCSFCLQKDKICYAMSAETHCSHDVEAVAKASIFKLSWVYRNFAPGEHKHTICDTNRHQHDTWNVTVHITREEVTLSSHPDAFKFSTKFPDTSISASAWARKHDSVFTDADMFQSSSFSIHFGFAKLVFPLQPLQSSVQKDSSACFSYTTRKSRKCVCLPSSLASFDHLFRALLYSYDLPEFSQVKEENDPGWVL